MTLLLVIMSSIGNNVRHHSEHGDQSGNGHINVAGFFKITSGQAAPVVTQYEKVRDTVSAVLPDAAVVDRLRGWGKVVSFKSSIQVGIGGIDVSMEEGFPRHRAFLWFTRGKGKVREPSSSKCR